MLKTRIRKFLSGVFSVNGRNGEVTLTKGDVGLDQVDNTSDANKPVSGPQQTAIDAVGASIGNSVSYVSQSKSESERQIARQNIRSISAYYDLIALSSNINCSSINPADGSLYIALNGYSVIGDHIIGGFFVSIGHKVTFMGPGDFAIHVGDTPITLEAGESYTIEGAYNYDGPLFSKVFDVRTYTYSSPMVAKDSSSLKTAENDAAAGSAGVEVGGIYRTSTGEIRWRVS